LLTGGQAVDPRTRHTDSRQDRGRSRLTSSHAAGRNESSATPGSPSSTIMTPHSLTLPHLTASHHDTSQPHIMTPHSLTLPHLTASHHDTSQPHIMTPHSLTLPHLTASHHDTSQPHITTPHSLTSRHLTASHHTSQPHITPHSLTL